MLTLTNTHRKSGKALVDSARVKGRFYVRCEYFVKAGYKSVRLFSHAYTIKADAEDDLTLFEYAIETDGAKNWKPNGDYYRPPFNRLRSGTKRCLDEPTSSSLNASQSCLFKCINKKLRKQNVKLYNSENGMHRFEFHNKFSCNNFSESEINRFLRCLTRTKPTSKEEKMIIDNLKARLNVLITHLISYEKILLHIKTLVDEERVFNLLIRIDGRMPQSTDSEEDFTHHALVRLHEQVDFIYVIFSNLKKKVIIERDLVTDFLRIGSFDKHGSWSYDNIKVEIEKCKKYQCVPVIIDQYLSSKCNEDRTKGTTVLQWYREFVKNNHKGFIEDRRGKHVR